jgi:hypothetical protein
MSDERITCAGKEILLDGRHIADAVDENTAEIIAIVLTYAGLPSQSIPTSAAHRIEDFFA